MKRNNKKTMYKIIIALIIVSSILSVVFAALTKNLTVNVGNVSQIASKWYIQINSAVLSVNTGGNSATGRVCGAASLSGDTITIGATKLSKPDDKCVWTITIKNYNGTETSAPTTMTARLKSITATAPTSNKSTTCTISNQTSGDTACSTSTCQYKMECGNITYKLTNSSTGGDGFPTNLASFTKNTDQVKTFYLAATFVGNSPSNSAEQQSGASFKLTYAQQ